MPERLAGSGRRGVRLGAHGNKAARRAHGVEACLVDSDEMVVSALDPADGRSCCLSVAGPAALVVAKVHKIVDRSDEQRARVRDKDALDVFRLLRAVGTNDFHARFAKLGRSELAGEVTSAALVHFARLFTDPSSEGVEMVVRATRPLVSADEVRAACHLLGRELMDAAG